VASVRGLRIGRRAAGRGASRSGARRRRQPWRLYEVFASGGEGEGQQKSLHEVGTGFCKAQNLIISI